MLPDPFDTQPRPGPFADPPRMPDPYGQPLPTHSQSQPMRTMDYMHPHFNPDLNARSSSVPPSTTVVGDSSYDLHGDNGEHAVTEEGRVMSAYRMHHVPV